MQRWGNNITFSSNDVPIVYAQPISLAQEGGRESREQSFQPTVSGDKSSVPPIQRKVDSSQAMPVQIQNTETSSPRALTHPYPLLGGESGRTEDQNRPELNGDPAKLQAKNSDFPITSANPSQINANPRSQFDEVTIFNQTTSASVNFSQINANPRSRSSLPVVNPSNRLVIPQQTQQNNDDQTKSTSIKDQELMVELPAQGSPKVTVQPLTYPNQLFNISRSQVKQNNSQQNIDILPVVPVTSQVNTSSQTRSSPLPLANKGSNSINQKTHQANQNSLGSNTSNTAAASSPRIIASSSPPTQTFVSARETQPKIDLDTITSKVEKKIMRRLVIESERRGKIR